MSVRENIKIIREKKHFSQLYMANCLKIAQSSYNKIENGQSKISLERFHQICKIFEMSMDELYHFDVNENKKGTKISSNNESNQEILNSILTIVKEQGSYLKNLSANSKK